MTDSLRPVFLDDEIQVFTLLMMDKLAQKYFKLSGGLAVLSVQTNNSQSGIVRYHIVDPKNLLRKKKVKETEGFHPIDYFGNGTRALMEAMKQHANSSETFEEPHASFPGAMLTMDVGGYTVMVGFSGGKDDDDNKEIAEFGLHILQLQIEKE